MSQQIRSFVIGVVGNYEALWSFRVALLLHLKMITHDQLQNLRRLAARGSAHIEHSVVRFDVTQEWRKHAHDLLTRQQARHVRILYHLMNCSQSFILFEELSLYHHFEYQVVWIKWLAVHFQLSEVQTHRPQFVGHTHVFGLGHADLILFAVGAVPRIIHQKLRVSEHLGH